MRDEKWGRSDRLRGVRDAESSWAIDCLNVDMASLGSVVTECRALRSGAAGLGRNGITAEDAEGGAEGAEDKLPSLFDSCGPMLA